METPPLNASQRAILDLLKRRGADSVPGMAVLLGLNVETVRGHVKGLEEARLVRREGRITDGPGRPEIVFGLSSAAEELYPRREADILRRLADYLHAAGHHDVLDDFFDDWIREQREAAMPRVRHLAGRERVEEVAKILSELGFMAVADRADGAGGTDGADADRLRLCHCPLRSLVDATHMPCRAEAGLVGELLGGELTRESYIPAGDPSCSYRLADMAG